VKANLVERLWNSCSADFFSPKDFVRHAMLIVLVFALIHALGLRDYTSVLNGTTGSVEMDPGDAALLGIVYILFYLAAILLAPILLIAAALIEVWQRIRDQKQLPRP
jgi:phosphotransferase system  glucose/maltose/N-acetylglucosamine-specific IIC component